MNAEGSSSRLWRFVKRRKVAVAVGVWAFIVAVLAVVSPSVTVREQTQIVDALPDLSAATGDAAALLSQQPYSFSIGGLTTEGSCRITLARDGEEYSRTVTVYAPEADTTILAESLADKLRERYRLEGGTDDDGNVNYTGVRSSFVEFELYTRPNTVIWTATSGCRPPGDSVGALAPVYNPPAESTAVLGELAVSSAKWSKASVECGDISGAEGSAATVTAVGELPEDTEPDLSVVAEGIPEDAALVISESELVAYRLADTSWTVTVDGDQVTVISTTDCRSD